MFVSVLTYSNEGYMQFRPLIGKLRDRLTSVVRDGAWQRAGSGLDSIAEVTVESLTRGADDDIAELADVVHQLYTEVVVDHDVDEMPRPAWVAAQLQGYSRLLGAAARNRRSLAPDEIAGITDDTSIRILKALHAANHGQSGIDLAKSLKVRAETIARKLPLLRAAGLIRSWPVGRLVLNALTTQGCQAIGIEQFPVVVSAPLPVNWMVQLREMTSEMNEKTYNAEREATGNRSFGNIKLRPAREQIVSRALPMVEKKMVSQISSSFGVLYRPDMPAAKLAVDRAHY
jgi:hypothetical protein